MSSVRSAPNGGYVIFAESANPLTIMPGDGSVVIDADRMIDDLTTIAEEEVMLDHALDQVARIAQSEWLRYRATAIGKMPKRLTLPQARGAAKLFLERPPKKGCALNRASTWNRVFRKFVRDGCPCA